MCGIAGIVSIRAKSFSRENLIEMSHAISMRGPDDCRIWESKEGPHVGLVHTRLAIVDPSEAGSQPMISSSQRYVITFNGEVYNHKSIRSDLNNKYGYSQNLWRGHSDTETLVESISTYGVEKALEKVSGMFAFAVWDRMNNQLWIARDRFGEKPLYYFQDSNRIVFSSNLKSLKKCGDLPIKINRYAAESMIRNGYVRHPDTIYENIKSLMPGQYKCFVADRHLIDLSAEGQFSENQGEIDLDLRDRLRKLTDNEIVTEFERLWNDTITEQMMSDVDLGVFLSGGIDSSIVAAYAQRNSIKKIRTYNIAFTEKNYDESNFAINVAKHLNTDHYTHFFSSKEALSLLPKVIECFDEPFADASQLPSYLVAYIASKDVKVALTGDGADELFGGYKKYNDVIKYHSFLKYIPTNLRSSFKDSLGLFLACYSFATRFASIKGDVLGDKIHKISRVRDLISFENGSEFYKKWMSQWQKGDGVFSDEVVLPLQSDQANEELARFIRRYDIEHYLADDILVKTDRTSMANGLEARAPFLGERIAEFSSHIFNLRRNPDGETKWILRRALKKIFPENMFDRQKAGFRIPTAKWLREDLKDFAFDTLSRSNLDHHGFLDSCLVERILLEHASASHNHETRIWNLLMFQYWYNCDKQDNIVNHNKLTASG